MINTEDSPFFSQFSANNQRLVLVSVASLVVIIGRLWLAATEFSNVRGFFLTSLHLLIVVAGVIWCLWERPDRNPGE